MSRVATAFAIACLAVSPGSILAGQRAGPGTRGASETAQSAAPYFPERFDWQHKKPEEVGMDAARLDEAVKQAIASENPATKEMMLYLATTFGASEPFDTPIGPVKDRGAANGLITRHGYIVAEWGDENFSHDGRRACLAARADSRFERLCARLHAAGRRSV